MTANFIEMAGITKRFGDVIANDSIDFKVRQGEIHALVGENGAGKTTLMNILYGLLHPDSGTILIGGEKKEFSSPSDAIEHGIGMVHQHFMLVGALTVLENIILGCEAVSAAGLLDTSKSRKKLAVLTETLGIKLNLDSRVELLPVGIQQKIEILKALYRNPSVLIFDEPTAVLTPMESEELFGLLKNLKQQGKTIILITHKLKEVLSISDRVTVLRHGKKAGEKITSETNRAELGELIIGGSIPSANKKIEKSGAETILEVERLSVESDLNTVAVDNISFAVKTGEIFGIAGVEGNGQTELIDAINGLRNVKSGFIKINGSDLISHIPADRKKNGIVNGFRQYENVLLGRQNEKKFYSGYTIDEKKLIDFTVEIMDKYDVRPNDPKLDISKLSGGNQQKLVVSRELTKQSRLVIACHPTRGLDIKAALFVRNSLLEERNTGKAVLLVSSDLVELMNLSDRIGIMYEGKISAIVKPSETNEQEIGMFMTGLNFQ